MHGITQTEYKFRSTSFHYEYLSVIFEYIFFRTRINFSNLLKDRKYHFKTYKNCFVGKEVVSWLVDCKLCDSRSSAVTALRTLQDHHILHHGKIQKISTICFDVQREIRRLLSSLFHETYNEIIFKCAIKIKRLIYLSQTYKVL